MVQGPGFTKLLTDRDFVPETLNILAVILAWIDLISVVILVLAEATVLVTGSGLGCPDWFTCWGFSIPPTSAG